MKSEYLQTVSTLMEHSSVWDQVWDLYRRVSRGKESIEVIHKNLLPLDDPDETKVDADVNRTVGEDVVQHIEHIHATTQIHIRKQLESDHRDATLEFLSSSDEAYDPLLQWVRQLQQSRVDVLPRWDKKRKQASGVHET